MTALKPTQTKSVKLILFVIIIAQFCCTSLWFAGNAVLNDLDINFGLDNNAIGHLTSAVQFGFITGTLTFAVLTIVDRFSPSKVFFISAILGAFFNAIMIWEGNSVASLLGLRFTTGFFLAGIYPVGMKIAVDYFDKGLGKSLGLLVGALVIGTAFPHLLKGIANDLPWRFILLSTSILAAFGGFIMLFFVPDGPYRKASQTIDFSACINLFENKGLRSAAFGYFGHMWELYTFWAFTPTLLQIYNDLHPSANLNIPVLSFCIIGIGGLACLLGGYISERIGTQQTASIALLSSGICCLFIPLLLTISWSFLYISFLLFWGMVVVADSPLFSTLIAQNAPPRIKGTALTIVNCIGFLITIISIQIVNYLYTTFNSNLVFTVLAIGPVFGLIGLREKIKIK